MLPSCLQRRDVCIGPADLKLLGLVLQAYEDGLPMPSWRDLMRAMGWKSPNAVRLHVRRLVGLGLLRQEPGKARTLAPAVQFSLD